MTATTHSNVAADDPSLDGARAWFSQKGLSRPREGRVLAGVAAGFARRYEINPLVARLLAIATIVVLSPIVYVAAWILMPPDADVEPAAASAA
ncbi:MAG TPA: PspC domain-containing protein [Solirubrobacteraceae bacterium]|nr:PspC domain-containing protein [Solirubrobacteraceae bacterium]